jgi:hypothetical protein
LAIQPQRSKSEEKRELGRKGKGAAHRFSTKHEWLVAMVNCTREAVFQNQPALVQREERQAIPLFLFLIGRNLMLFHVVWCEYSQVVLGRPESLKVQS